MGSTLKSYRPDVRRSPIKNIEDLWQKWDRKNRYEGDVLGALELAYLRGYQGGYEDGKAGKRQAKHYRDDYPFFEKAKPKRRPK